MKCALLAVLILGSGCGMVEDIKCGGDHKAACEFLFGTNAQDIKQLEKENRNQQTQIDLLIQNLELINQNLGSQILALESLVLTGHIVLINQIVSLQLSIVNNQVQIATLQGYQNIVSIIDVCGDGPGVDEVLLRLSSGQLLASFSQNASGLNTRFAVLPAGSYVTSDGSSCHFTVDANNKVTDQFGNVWN